MRTNSKKYRFCIYCGTRLPWPKQLYCSVGCKNKYHEEHGPFKPKVKGPVVDIIKISNRKKKIIDLHAWYSTKYPNRNPQKDAEELKSAFKTLQLLIKEIKNSGCMICGYNKSYSGLHFHHINGKSETIASLKSGNILGMLKEFLEYDIVLLCANCHAEVHEGVLDISHLEPININTVISSKTQEFRHL